METATMGRVTTEAVVENIGDVYAADRKLIPAAVRRFELVAAVDPNRVLPALPAEAIAALGLVPTWAGRYSGVRLTVGGRAVTTDVSVAPPGSPAVIGRAALLAMDWVIDEAGGTLVGNPAHGGEWVIEMY